MRKQCEPWKILGTRFHLNRLKGMEDKTFMNNDGPHEGRRLLPFYEGEAPRTLFVEGATRAPVMGGREKK